MAQHYIITYDLRSQRIDYTRLTIAIKSFSHWAHPLERVWIIYTEDDAEDIFNNLKQFIEVSTDRLLIVKMPDIERKSIQGWLGSNFWTWLANTSVNSNER